MKHIFGATLVLSFFLVLFFASESARNAGFSTWLAGGLFLSFVAFVTYHVLVTLYQDYKELHKVTK